MQDATFQAAVNAGCLLLMPPLAPEQYRDVMASLLYVQLAASKKQSVFTAPRQWQEILASALKQFGWSPISSGYRQYRPDAAFTLGSLLEPLCGPGISGADQAREQLCRSMAERPPTDRALGIIQRNTTQYIGIDAADGNDSDAAPDKDSEGNDDFLLAVEPLPVMCGKTLRAYKEPLHQRAQSALPHAAVAAHFGLILPGRRLQLLSMHFDTRERLTANIFAQSFSSTQLLGNVLIKTFSGTLSEQGYAPFRARFNRLLEAHWARQVIENFPFNESQGAKP
jgi:hypothetical protein